MSKCQERPWKHVWRQILPVKKLVKESEQITKNIIQEEELKKDDFSELQELNFSKSLLTYWHNYAKNYWLTINF